MIHELKILSSFIRPILDRSKTFEIRENDRGFQKGDRVQFKVVSDDWTRKNSSIVREFEQKVFEITYVINGWGLKDGFVVFGISEVEE
jgi:DNA-directed RNA polymerase subunit E'/Rpb7